MEIGENITTSSVRNSPLFQCGVYVCACVHACVHENVHLGVSLCLCVCVCA